MNKKHVSRASRRKNGMTRREFMHQCALPTMTAMTLSPILEGLLRSEQALAAGAPPNIFPISHINLAGGWGFNGTFVGKTSDGNIVSRTTMQQHGIAAGFGDPVATGLITDFGALMYPTTVSTFAAGFMSIINAASDPAALKSKIRMVVYHTESPDDNTAGNKSGLAPILANAGVQGTLASMAGTSTSASGNGTAALATSLAAQNLTVNSAGDVLNAIAFSRVLSNHSATMQQMIANAINSLGGNRLNNVTGTNAGSFQNAGSSALGDFVAKANPSAGIDVLNPTMNAAVATIWGLTANTASSTFVNRSDRASVQATMAYALLNGYVGMAAYGMGGYDYHGQTFTSTKNMDNNAGIMAGRMIATADALGKPHAIWLTTDGGLSAKAGFDPTNNNDNQWAGDRSKYSGAALIVYFPSSTPTQNVTNVGDVDATNGQLNPSAATATVDMATAHMFYNLALLGGNPDVAVKQLLASGYSQAQINAIVAMPPLFS